MTWHVNRLHQNSLQGVSLICFSDYPGGNKSEKKRGKKSVFSAFTLPMGLPECFSDDFTLQRPDRPISPLLYHCLRAASCHGDVTLHMVFSSINPEKWFSQRRGEAEERTRAWRGHSLEHNKTNVSLFPFVALEMEGRGGGGKEGNACFAWG